MTLDDLVKGFENFANSMGIVQTLQKDPKSPAARQQFIPLYIKHENIPEDRAPYLDAEYTRNDGLLRNHAEAVMGDYHAKFSETMEKGYIDVVKALDGEKLKSLAFMIPDAENKEYLEVLHLAQEEGNLDVARKAFANLNPKSQLWADFCIKGSPEFVKQFMEKYAQDEQKRFERECLNSESEKDGKKGYKIDTKKTQEYIISNIAKLSGEQKEQIYTQLMTSYLASKKKK